MLHKGIDCRSTGRGRQDQQWSWTGSISTAGDASRRTALALAFARHRGDAARHQHGRNRCDEHGSADTGAVLGEVGLDAAAFFAEDVDERLVDAVRELGGSDSIQRARRTLGYLLYSDPSAATPHPCESARPQSSQRTLSNEFCFDTMAAMPHADSRAARVPISCASRLKNCRSGMVVSRPKKCVNRPVTVSSSSVGSASIKLRKAVSKL